MTWRGGRLSEMAAKPWLWGKVDCWWPAQPAHPTVSTSQGLTTPYHAWPYYVGPFAQIISFWIYLENCYVHLLLLSSVKDTYLGIYLAVLMIFDNIHEVACLLSLSHFFQSIITPQGRTTSVLAREIATGFLLVFSRL